MNRKYCFFNEKRLCTIKCRAAYEAEDEIYCWILWILQQVGYQIRKKKRRKG